MTSQDMKPPTTKRVTCALLQGQSRQMGETHGALVADVFANARRDMMASSYWHDSQRSFPANLLDLVRALRLTRWLRKSLKLQPGATEYISGMRSQPKISAGTIYFLLLSEVLGADRSRIAHGLGCSGVMVEVGGDPLIGKNFDYQYALSPYQGVLVRKETNRRPYVAFTPILMPFGGQLCMNDRGLTVSYNYSYSRGGSCLGGLPASYLVHDICSRCENADDAVELVQNREYTIGNGASLAVADHSRRYLVEVAADLTGVLSGESCQPHTNHFQSETLRPWNISHQAKYASRLLELQGAAVIESSITRLSKLYRLASKAATRTDLRDVLSECEDADGSNNIYQEGPYWGTICTLIASPSRMTVYRYDDVRVDQPVVHDVTTLLASPLPNTVRGHRVP